MQAYYKQLKSNAKQCLQEEILLDMVQSYRKQMPRIGGTKLHYLINQSGYKIGRKVLYDLLRNHGLLVRKRKKRAVTTDSRHWMRKWPNLIRGFDFYRPNQLWVSDITYIDINDDFVYLSLITDAYSRKIMGYNLCLTLESESSVIALRKYAGKTSNRTDTSFGQRFAILLQRICENFEKQQYTHKYD